VDDAETPMTLGICVAIPEGIVMAGESRQGYQGRAGARISSDSATKVFELSDVVLAATSGWAFLRPQGATTHRNIASLIEELKVTLPANPSVKDAADALYAYFNQAYQWHTAQGYDQPVPAGQIALTFLVGGYDPNSRVGLVFVVNVPGGVSPLRDTNNPGPNWIGQFDVVARIIKGCDPRVANLAFVQQLGQQGGQQVIQAIGQQLNGLEYVINWHAMTLQDAIDFATSMIQITISIQRFTDGIQMSPGDVAGVGGPIDVALVKPNNRPVWIRKKELHA